MSIEFFKLPAALKKAIWAAYLAEWKKKQAAKKARHPLKQVTGLQDEFSTTHLVSQSTTERR